MDRYDRELGTLRANVDEVMRGQTELRDEMRAGFARLEATLLGDVRERLNKHSDRLGSLERWRSWLTGAYGVLLAIGAWLVGWRRS